MYAEHAVGGVRKVCGGVIGGGLYHAFGIPAGLVPVKGGDERAAAAGIAAYLPHIVGQPRHRRTACYHRIAARYIGRGHLRIHALQIGKGASHRICGYGKGEAAVGFEQYTVGIHQGISHRAYGCLTEIAALGMLDVRFSREESYLNVCERRACQHA